MALTLALLFVPAAAAAPRPKAGSTGSAVLSQRTTRSVAVTTAAASTGSPLLVTNKTTPPAGYRLNADEVERIAAANPTVIAELHRHPRLVPYEYTKGAGQWQVSWFTRPGKVKQREMIQVYVNDASGKVTQAWTGFQVAWTMARGYPGAFGRVVNSWWLWLPLCLLFVAPFVPWRRRPALLHLDLLMLLGFSVSLAFFNHADIGMSAPLVYPFLLYVLVRMLLLAFGRGRPRQPLRINVPVVWLAVAIVFLMGFRIGLNIADSNVIDVGYAGVIGAQKLTHDQPLYGGWPSDNLNGDTYGPVNYEAYVPAYLAFGWSGLWDDLPAAHAAAIAFDVLTLLGLFLLGRRVRGPSTGIVLAYLWAAYPFSLYALSSNSNDSLVACLLVFTLLVITWAPARGAFSALAGLTKLAPLALAPLFLRGVGPPPRRRSIITFVLAFAAVSVAAFAPVLARHDLHSFWTDSVVYQANRPAPFSVWGLYGGLSVEQHIVQGLAVGLAILVAFVPRRRTIVEVAALGAAIIIALQLGLAYWFYLYIPWFFPFVIIALVCAHPGSRLQPALQAFAQPELERHGFPIVSDSEALGTVGA